MNTKLLWLLTVFLFAGVHFAEAQQVANVPRIGILANFPAPQIDALEQSLRDAGYVEGRSVIIERRYAEGKLDRFSELALELVQLKVSRIVSVGQRHPMQPKASRTFPSCSGLAVIRLTPGLRRALHGQAAMLLA